MAHRLIVPLEANLYGRSLGQACPHRFLAGGKGGMRSFFESFGDTLTLPYSRLEAPLLSNGLADKVIRQCDDAYRHYSADDLENWRDRNIRTLTRELRALEDLPAS